MAEYIKVRPATGTWSVRAGGAVLGETSNALELIEGDYPPVIYFPREDIAMAFLDSSDASYYSVVTKSRTLKDAVWSYENPKPAAAALKDHLAFYKLEEITVERI